MRAVTGLQMAIRVLGVVQLVLGVLFWTNRALDLVDLHQLIGILLVLALWTLAALAHRAGVPGGVVAGAVVLGLLVPIIGLTQRELLVGSAHWVIEVVHLLLGVGLLGMAENLATQAKARRTTAA